jgi:hypothetical protein
VLLLYVSLAWWPMHALPNACIVASATESEVSRVDRRWGSFFCSAFLYVWKLSDLPTHARTQKL